MAIIYKTTLTERAPRDTSPLSNSSNTTAPDPVPPDNTGWRLVGTTVSDNVVYYTWAQGDGDMVVTVTSSPYDMIEGNKYILADASSEPITINLITPSTDGTQVSIKKVDNSSNAIIIDANSTANIDGQQTQTIFNQWTSLELVSNQSNWVIV